jgi:hypothetical protein
MKKLSSRKIRARNSEDVIDALVLCILASSYKPTRYSDIRKELSRVAKEAKTAQVSLRRLRNAVESLSPLSRESLERLPKPVAKIALTTVKNAPFHALSSVALAAQFYSSTLKGRDRGGAPTRLAFRMLIVFLARAFKNATNREAKVTWNEYKDCYTGAFIRFVEAGVAAGM